MHKAFWWARDYEIYKPWYHRVNAEGRGLGNERDAMRVERRFRATVEAGVVGARLAQVLYGACRNTSFAGVDTLFLYSTDLDATALANLAGAHLAADRITSVTRDNPALVAAIRAALG